MTVTREGAGDEADREPSADGSDGDPARADWQRDRLVALGQLSANFAHEINGCLAALGLHLGEAQAIADRAGDDSEPWARVQTRLAGVAECANRIAELVDELRRFGRPDAAALEPVQLDDVVRAALKLTSPLIGRVARSEIALGRPTPVLGRPSALIQIVVNLLRNAADALGELSRSNAGNQIVVSTREQNGEAIIRVEDNGPGIAPELLARLPTRYLSTKPSDMGTGLGLAICQDIAVAHGGSLHLDSARGSGTRVEIRLPIARDQS